MIIFNCGVSFNSSSCVRFAFPSFCLCLAPPRVKIINPCRLKSNQRTYKSKLKPSTPHLLTEKLFFKLLCSPFLEILHKEIKCLFFIFLFFRKLKKHFTKKATATSSLMLNNKFLQTFNKIKHLTLFNVSLEVNLHNLPLWSKCNKCPFCV